MEISVTVTGEPVAQGRPRFNRYTGRAYDPEKSKVYKALVKTMAKKVAPPTPVVCPVALVIWIYRSIPKSFTKKQRKAIEGGTLRPTTKPDVSNIVKGIEDALNGLWYADDSQIVCSVAGKYYADEPRVHINMKTLEGDNEIQ